jgi:catechol 2,3-dioxygenase-like lactoylglutathione lyase family enzyme
MLLGDTYLVFVQATLLDQAFHRRRPGLNHLAFRAAHRAQVDRLTGELRRRGWTILYPERHPRAGGGDSYSLFFEGPERLKIELTVDGEAAADGPATGA